jgi:hypothetical protein
LRGTGAAEAIMNLETSPTIGTSILVVEPLR